MPVRFEETVHVHGVQEIRAALLSHGVIFFREQDITTAQHIAGLCNNREGRDQGRRHAGSDDQCGQSTHDECADRCATLLIAANAGKFGLYAAGHLHVVSAEHAKCQHDEQTGEQDENPGLIECCLQLQTSGCRGDSCQGINKT